MSPPGALFFFAVLFAIARTGYPIQCEVSHSTGTLIKRSTSLQTCAPEYDACKSVVIEATRYGKTVRFVKKSCTKKESCVPGAIFMHLNNGLQETGNTFCCTTDGCNSKVPALPPRNETLNDLWCPACEVKHPEPCNQEVLHCRGWEDKCFSRKTGSIIQMGCASETFCANSAQTGVVIMNTLGVTLSSQSVQCKPAHGS